MANGFQQASLVAMESFKILQPLIASRADDGRYVTTDKGRLSRKLQESLGDIVMNKNGNVCCIELKAETKDTGNLFLEEWSNRHWWNRGWMDKLDTDSLWYHTISVDRLLIVPFPELRAWAFTADSRFVSQGVGRMYDYKSRPQSRYEQMNDTWGRCVPIDVIKSEVGLVELNPLALLQNKCAHVARYKAGQKQRELFEYRMETS